jgi:GTP-binding protein
MRSKSAVERADVAVVVFDAHDGLKAQDMHVMGLALDEHTGIVVFGNKWDLMADTWEKGAYVNGVKRRLRFATWAPVVVGSALAGIGLEELLREVRDAGEERKKRAQTSELNAIMHRAMARRPPPLIGKKRLKLLYVTQPRVEPPTFVFFVNDSDTVSPNYARYLENALRRAFGYRGASLRLVFRSRGEGEWPGG